MTQIVVTLEKNADEILLRRMIENMKGVVKTTLTHSHKQHVEKEDTHFMDSLHEIKKAIDPSLIDINDLKRYISTETDAYV